MFDVRILAQTKHRTSNIERPTSKWVYCGRAMQTDSPSRPTLADRLREIPVWASILIVAIVLAGAGWVGWKQFFATPSSGEEFDVGPVNTGRMRGFARMPAPPAKDGITLLGAGLWHIKSGDFSMNLPIKNTEVRVYYERADLIPSDKMLRIQAWC